MNNSAKSRRTFWCLLPSFTRYSLILLLAGVFLSSVATTGSTSVQIAQRSETASQQATSAAAKRLFDEGLQLYKQGTAESRRQAIEKFKQALPLMRQVGEKVREATTLNNIGKVYSDLGEKQQALNYYNQSLPLSRQVGDKAGVAATLNNIGKVYSDLGDKQQALNYYNQSLPLRQQVRDKRGEATTLNNIGKVYSDLGENQQALNYYNQSLPLSRQEDDKPLSAITLSNIGKVHSDLGKNQQALNYYNQSLRLSREVGDKALQATTLDNIGSVYSNLGEKQQALNYYNQSLPLSAQVGDKAQSARTLNNIGSVYDSLGEKQQALNYYNQSLPLSRQVGDKAQEAATLSNIGLVYDDLGDNQQALNYYNQSLPLSRQVGNKAGEAATFNNIGGVYDALGEKQQALNYYNQSLPLSRQVGDKALEAGTLNNIGKVYSNLGEKQQALNYYNQSLPLSRLVGDKARQATTLYNIAFVERDRGNLQQALTQIQAAIKIIEDLRTKVDSQDLRTSYFASQQDVYKFYIDLLMQLHKKDPSKGYNAQALHISERSRARGLIELLTEARANIRKGVDPKHLAEEKRLQELIDAKEKRRFDIVNSGKIKDPIAKANAEKLQKEVSDLLTQRKELETQIRTSNPKFGKIKYPKPEDILKLPQIQQQLDKDSLLLEYSLGEERSYLWAVTPNSIDSYELPARKQIEDAATEFKGLLNKCQVSDCQKLSAEKKAQDIKQTALSASKLSKIILAPVADKLGQKRLVIVADGALQTIPFAALNDVETGQRNVSTKKTEVSYQPLIVKHEIVNLPSVTTIATQRQDLKGRIHAPKTLAVLADPVFEANDCRVTGKDCQASDKLSNIAPNLDLGSEIEQSQLKKAARNLNRNGFRRLEGTETEAKAILQLVPSDNLQAFDFDANYNWVTNKQLSQYRFLHFATHGFADPNNPELSGIVLSQFLDKQAKPADRGYLRLGDIFNLDFAADLVVLSACDTGLGKNVNGEGLVGLTRGLMYAGAERVAVSLWQVNDDGTIPLMQEFYTQMLSQRKPPTVALRAAQMKLWQDQKWQNPYYWSAFTLQGEWR
ncbi:CHAT domain-containing tetratricopeptide repeat protein [Tolypothrix sp. VBCCA 56010]|uniref:CHAT domain-containing tetratricopeptide repeat protein n=1 Tax=Tolypothrix sp. VBCCA 56010 TaxID=3137731 RepID=UPI003D7CF218